MNWWRRNWVDALMIALIVGVVGGFAALLLRGSTLSIAPPASPDPKPSPVVSSPAAVDPPPVASTPPPTPPVAAPPPVTPPAAPVVPNKPPASPTKPPVVSSPPAANPVSSNSTASQPASNTKPTSSAMTKPAPGSGLGGNEPAQPTAMAATPKVAKPIAPPAAPAPVKPKPAPIKPKPAASGVSRSQFLKSYRVAVGSFSGSARANSAAAGLRARGLPAVALPSGDVMIVVVGPYASESAARDALNRVQPSYPDAILYRPDGSRSRAPTAPTATPSVKTLPNSTQPAATAPDEGTYLQVAAFRNISAATPLLTKLRSSGYPAFLRSSPDGFTRVLVGPLAQDALRQARADLQKRGHQPFAVTK